MHVYISVCEQVVRRNHNVYVCEYVVCRSHSATKLVVPECVCVFMCMYMCVVHVHIV